MQNAKVKAGQGRSAKAGLAIALAIFNFVELPLAGLAQSPQAISSASPSAGDSSLAPPITRIKRPGVKIDGAASGQAGSDIKLMPLQPVTDPIDTPINSPNPPAAGQPGHSPTAPARPVQLGPGGEDPYPTIGKLESLTTGAAQPTAPITDRLARLENTVFKKVFASESLFDRTDRLKKTLLGPDYVDPNSAAARDRDGIFPLGQPFTNSSMDPTAMPNLGGLGLGALDMTMGGMDAPSAVQYLDEVASRPENREAAPPAVLNQFALELINTERHNAGLAPLAADNVGDAVAARHIQELASRSALSHFSLKGENPDKRYTMAGGNDAMVESIASVKCADMGGRKLSRAAVARTLRSLLGRQDDRDALMSPDATHFGFAMAVSADKDKLLSTFEVISRHGVIEPIAQEVAVGDKLEVKGAVEAPYIFDRITIAWEAYNGGGTSSSADESEEALPYFPPLDYVAYASKSDRDYSKAIFALKAAGVVAAIAGGVFIPPVALAAPLIMMSGGMGSEPKPVSDIPVKGGVKVDGATFDAKIPISNGGKEGLYYITVYGSLGSHAQQSVAISRRVIYARQLAKGEILSTARPATKYDEEVQGQAEIKGVVGTAGDGDLKPSPAAAGKGNKDNAGTRETAPLIYSPESQLEGKSDAPTKP